MIYITGQSHSHLTVEPIPKQSFLKYNPSNITITLSHMAVEPNPKHPYLIFSPHSSTTTLSHLAAELTTKQPFLIYNPSSTLPCLAASPQTSIPNAYPNNRTIRLPCLASEPTPKHPFLMGHNLQRHCLAFQCNLPPNTHSSLSFLPLRTSAHSHSHL